jgi:Domain of unknown function (DUF5060)
VIGTWRTAEIALTAAASYRTPYTDVNVWADFTSPAGVTLRRPAFCDGPGSRSSIRRDERGSSSSSTATDNGRIHPVAMARREA